MKRLLSGALLAIVLPALLGTGLLAQSQLALSSGGGLAGSAISLNLSLSSPSGSEPSGIAWTFSYPVSTVASIAVMAGPALTAVSKTLNCVSAAGTYSCIAFGLNANIIDNGIAATVSVTLANTVSSTVVGLSGVLGASPNGGQITITPTLGTINATNSSVLKGISCSPSSLAPGAVSVCTVTLSNPVADGAIVALNSPGSLAVPTSVSIASNSAIATFNVTAGTFTSNQTASIIATLNGVSASTNLSLVVPIALTDLACARTSLATSSSTTCWVTLSKAAPAGGSAIMLTSSATSALTVPASVTIAQAATAATFTATAAAVTLAQTATLTAAYYGTSKTVTLTIAPIILTSLGCASTSLVASSSTTCTVTLSKAAPAGGSTLTLTSSATSALTVPASVTVAQGATAATFSATAAAVILARTATITTTFNGTSKTVILRVAPIILTSLGCASTSLAASSSTTCTVTLSEAAPAGGSAVTLASSAASALTVPASVTVAQAATAATFTAAAAAVTSDQTTTIAKAASVTSNTVASIRATVGSSSATITLSVILPKATTTLSALQLRCDRRQIAAGGSVVCEVEGNPGDTAGAVEFTLTSSSARVRVPAKLRGRDGRSTVAFEVVADEESPQEDVVIEASSPSGSTSESLFVTSSAPIYLSVPQNLTVTPGLRVRFTADAADDHGLPVSIIVMDMPKGSSFDATSGRFEWIPTDLDLGGWEISFTAANSLGLTRTKAISINVVSSRPILTGLRNRAGSGAMAACSPGTLVTMMGTSLVRPDSMNVTRVLVNGADASVIRASGEQVDFLCPRLAPGTPLGISLQVDNQASNEVRAVMQEAAPGLLSVDGSGIGQGMIVHARGLAALPRFDRVGMPAAVDEAITLFATGINCDEGFHDPSLLLYFGQHYQHVTRLQPSAFAGVCEVHSVVPGGLYGNEVQLVLESVHEGGRVVRSNPVLMSIEKQQTTVPVR